VVLNYDCQVGEITYFILWPSPELKARSASELHFPRLRHILRECAASILSERKIHMKRTLLLGTILLLSSVWAVGQSYANNITVDGYLSKSGGIFNLADETSGTTYQLTGDAAVLENHVGQIIRVSGTMSPFDDESLRWQELPQDMGGPTGSNVIHVASVEDASSNGTYSSQ
jgi:hypothetical protein